MNVLEEMRSRANQSQLEPSKSLLAKEDLLNRSTEVGRGGQRSRVVNAPNMEHLPKQL